MTLYKFPSGRIVSDEDYKKVFAEEYPADRPEASPDFVIATNSNVQATFDSSDSEDND
jgi:hypothetical protein